MKYELLYLIIKRKHSDILVTHENIDNMLNDVTNVSEFQNRLHFQLLQLMFHNSKSYSIAFIQCIIHASFYQQLFSTLNKKDHI